ncbi:MAG: RIP metalloprotease RseP [Candidatus Paceibacterota bacterium]
MSIIIFFVILLILVIVHEAGHFYSAKKFSIRVDEFGFGFPPKLYGKKVGETEYSFNLLPIGGFVKIFGENPDDENTFGPDKDRSFINKPKWQQAIVLGAGVFANFLLAWVLFSFGFMSGMPTSVSNVNADYSLEDVRLLIVSVIPESPAEKAGLESGDTIVSLQSGNDLVTTDVNPEILKSFVSENANKEIEIGYYRAGEENVDYLKVIPASENGGEPMIGISMDLVGVAKLPIFKAFSEGMKYTLFATKSTAVGLYSLIKEAILGRGSMEYITGPVGMVGIVGDAYDLGISYLLSFAAIISINLAIINLLPFPALDGGRLFFLLIEKIKGSRLNPRFTNAANLVGFAILILFMIAVTYHDITLLF